MIVLLKTFQIQMSTNFSRNDVQVYVENAQNCYDKERWSNYKQTFESWQISYNDILPLKNCLESDLTSYFFKAFESFSQALIDIKNHKSSWAIVKLYYSTFYLLRCDILLSNHLIIRCKGMYYSEIIQGKQFIPFVKGKVRGDHQLTIALLKDLHDKGKVIDPILDNELEDVDAYTWLMSNRERINYQQKNFAEPGIDNTLTHINVYFEHNNVNELFEFYNSKDYSICFDLDHSVLSIPYKKMIQIWKKSNGRIDLTGYQLKKIAYCIRDLRTLNINREFLTI